MAEPLEFQVVQDLQAALKGISVSAGYHFDLAGQAVKLDPNHEIEDLIPGADAPIGPPRPFVILDLSEPDEFEYAKYGHVIVRRPFRIVWVNDTDPTNDDSLLETYFRGLADIEQAIAADHQRSGKAIDTRILSREMREPQGRQVWASVAGVVSTNRAYGAPNA